MVAAVVLLRVARERIPQIAQEIADIDGVAEVYSVSGEWDLIAIIRVPEWEQIAVVVTEKLAHVDGITGNQTLISFRVYSKGDMDAAYSMFE